MFSSFWRPLKLAPPAAARFARPLSHHCIDMEMDTPLKEGYLLFPPQGVLGQLKKSWHKKFCQVFKPSKRGIERLEVFDSEDDTGTNTSLRIITLENCVKITPDAQKHQLNVFTIVTKTSTHHIAALSENEMSEWIRVFQSVAFKDDCSRRTIEEDNDLYCSSGEGVFMVNLVSSEASRRCGLEPGAYTLVVSSAAIQLRDSANHHLHFVWPYRYIRRYGYREGKFTFEAGRKCDTGEGTFHLEHSNQQEIFRCLSSKMKSMRKLLRGDAAIVCGDTQFQAALSMEAGSRSPLPPSPTSTTTLLDIDFSNAISQSSLKPLISPTTEMKPLIAPKPKLKPVKAPRKHILASSYSQSKLLLGHDELSTDSFERFGKYRKFSGVDLVAGSMVSVSPLLSSADTDQSSAYDKVEVRKEAWRTLGIDDMMHTERCVDSEQEPNHVLPESKLSNIEPRVVPCSKILPQQVSNKSADPSENYDTLQHFGSSSKLNTNSGYQHIQSPVGLAPISFPASESSQDQCISWNDYSVIEEGFQSFRLADDSHQGYGMIRKKPVPDAQAFVTPSHKMYNEQEYALVVKPKRV
uniref:Insulin receptor substrate 1 n=1 Tax=Timema cristinae TaxID=61476 RepID=A0A7R9CDZ9_TIMCR|nr:unnamed protein product [Timema cristinae]